MSPRRFLEVARVEFLRGLRRPMLWVWLAILTLMTWGLSAGGLQIQSGDAATGGQKAWLTSEYALALVFVFLTTLLHSFFASVLCGLSVIQDEENKVSAVLRSTPLRDLEYAGGKLAGSFALVVGMLLAHGVLAAFFLHVVPNADTAELKGPFELANYLRPLFLLAAPGVLFMASLAFAIGTWTRKAIPVFVLPVAVFLLCGFFLWNWSPSWLDPAWNDLLQWLDPGGFRWLNETWLNKDLGAQFYNEQPIGYDAPFLLSRLAFVLVGLGAAAWASLRLSAAERGRTRRLPHEAVARAIETPPPAPPREASARLGELHMGTGPVGFVAGCLHVARAELRELVAQPGLYLFVPLILLQATTAGRFAVGAFDTPVLLTPGTLAASMMNTLTLLICMLLLFYTVESLVRDQGTGFAPIVNATPTRLGSFLFGKALANSVVGTIVLLAAFLACAALLLFQSGGPGLSIGPFVLLWGLLMIPTFLVWTSFVTAVLSLTGNRYTTYGLCLAAMSFTGYRQLRGEMNWVGNWDIWGAVQWSDMGPLALNSEALLLNRLFVLALTVFFIAVTVRLWPRRERDATRLVHRLQPGALAKSALRLSPWGAPALVLGILLFTKVSAGFQSEAAEKEQKDYWRRNVATYTDAKVPSIADVKMELELWPSERRLKAKGEYLLRNHHDEPLRELLVTPDPAWTDLEWTLDGEEVEPDDRAGLMVFRFDEPLAPEERVRLGFAYEGKHPDGFTKNGGGAGTFILDSGVVLTSFGASMAPLLGYQEGVGVDEDNRYDAKDFEDDFWQEKTPAGFGPPVPFTTRITVTGPEDWRFNSIGVLEDETVADGRRTFVWASDEPVNFFNVVGGRWAEHRGEGTAIFYHPEHDWNVEEMGQALDAARKYYSEWFWPFPWQELKLSEFPALAGYAQGFATNITFSENIGFLTRSTPETAAAFLVTAHEAAHQWWGNILMPGQGPGGNILSEGMAHYSTILLHEQVKGLRERIEFCKRIEDRYTDNRQVDSERPLVKVDGSRPGDTTVTYDKGGWVFWMLHRHLGREAMLAGLQDFIGRYRINEDHPVLQDFLVVMREHAADPEAFDAFAQQWFHEVVLPHFVVDEARLAEGGGSVEATVTNEGEGTVTVEVAAVRGERFPDEDEAEEAEDWQEARVSVELAAGESKTVTIPCDFEPERVVVDPDALVLQFGREKAEAEL